MYHSHQCIIYVKILRIQQFFKVYSSCTLYNWIKEKQIYIFLIPKKKYISFLNDNEKCGVKGQIYYIYMYISLREMVHKKNVQKLSWENMQKEEKSLVQTVVGEMIRNSIPETIFVLNV